VLRLRGVLTDWRLSGTSERALSGNRLDYPERHRQNRLHRPSGNPRPPGPGGARIIYNRAARPPVTSIAPAFAASPAAGTPWADLNAERRGVGPAVSGTSTWRVVDEADCADRGTRRNVELRHRGVQPAQPDELWANRVFELHRYEGFVGGGGGDGHFGRITTQAAGSAPRILQFGITVRL
jgi:hypothetical protein